MISWVVSTYVGSWVFIWLCCLFRLRDMLGSHIPNNTFLMFLICDNLVHQPLDFHGTLSNPWPISFVTLGNALDTPTYVQWPASKGNSPSIHNNGLIRWDLRNLSTPLHSYSQWLLILAYHAILFCTCGRFHYLSLSKSLETHGVITHESGEGLSGLSVVYVQDLVFAHQKRGYSPIVWDSAGDPWRQQEQWWHCELRSFKFASQNCGSRSTTMPHKKNKRETVCVDLHTCCTKNESCVQYCWMITRR